MFNPPTAPKPIITLTVDADTLATLAHIPTEQARDAFVRVLVGDAARRRERLAPDAFAQIRRLLDEAEAAL